MTGQQYKVALRVLGLSQGQAAELLGVSLRTSHGYANDAPIPEAVAKLLSLMMHFGVDPRKIQW